MNIDSLNFMIVEIVTCLALAALIGLAVGWLIRRSIAKRQLLKAEQAAKIRYQELEETSRLDAQNLEDQLQLLGSELKTLKGDHQNLNDSLRKSEDTLLQARDESIEVNQAQQESNKRLQTIIQHKDEEIARLLKTPAKDNANLMAAAAQVGASPALIARVSPSIDEDMDANETLDATTVIRNAPLGAEQRSGDSGSGGDSDNEKTVAALEASAEQLRSERQALLHALSDGEATIAIDHADLPIELQQTIDESDIDATVAISDMDETVNVGNDDTEMSDTLENP